MRFETINFALFRLILCAIVLLSITVNGKNACDTSRDNKISIDLIGEPVCKIKITWKSFCNQTFDEPVTYHIYYHKISSNRVCSSLILNNSQLGLPHCARQSSKPNEIHHCILDNRTVHALDINFARQETICIVKESRVHNRTWYTFNECAAFVGSNGPHCFNTCPPPDNVRVKAFQKRALTVIYDAPKCTSAMMDIVFKITYRPVQQSTSQDFQTHKITDNKKQFAMKDNVYNIANLEPWTLYEVGMCCYFKIKPDRCVMSKAHFARTLEEAPSRPPIVTTALLEKGTLMVKFKLPLRNTLNGRLVMYKLEIWRSNINCSVVYHQNIVKKEKITPGDIQRGDVNVTVHLPEGKAFCYRVKVRTAPGWSPWSRVHHLQDLEENSEATNPHKIKYTTYIVISVVGVVVLVLVIIFVLWLFMSRRRNSNIQERLPELHDTAEEESITSFTDIDGNEYTQAIGQDQMQHI